MKIPPKKNHLKQTTPTMNKTQGFTAMKYLILSGLLTGISLQVNGQNTGSGQTGKIGNEDVTIIKDYQPVLNDAFKINIQPGQDTSLGIRTGKLTYNLDAYPLNTAFTSSPIKPVRLKDDAIKKLYRGWVKAGYGLENMPLIDASYNSLRSKDFDAGIGIKHLSATGKIKDFGFPGNGQTSANAFGTRYFGKFSLGARIGYEHNMVHYYGFRNPPERFSKAETRHSMDDINGSISLASNGSDKDNWQHHSKIDFYSFSDNIGNDENNLNIGTALSKGLTNAIFRLEASADLGRIVQNDLQAERNIIRFQPSFVIQKELLTMEIGGRAVMESNKGESDYHLYPHLRADYSIIKDALRVYAGISGNLKRNDLRGFSTTNPFFGENVPLNNTNQTLDLSAGTIIKLDRDLIFKGEFSRTSMRNAAFFYNLYNSDFPVTFSAKYDDVTLLNGKASIEFRRNEKASVALQAEYNHYNMDELSRPFYIPAFRAGINGHYDIGEKILVKADIFFNSGVTGIAYTKKDSTITASNTELKGWVDMNIGVDYRYSKVLSAWASLNNLGFSRYFRWYEYPSYRFIGMMGVTYSF